MRIAHFGTFDVENFGDLLFPLIAADRLSGLDADISRKTMAREAIAAVSGFSVEPAAVSDIRALR